MGVFLIQCCLVAIVIMSPSTNALLLQFMTYIAFPSCCVCGFNIGTEKNYIHALFLHVNSDTQQVKPF